MPVGLDDVLLSIRSQFDDSGTDAAERALGDVGDEADELEQQVGGVGQSFAGLAGPLAIGAVIGAIETLGQRAIEIDNLAQSSGVAHEVVGELAAALERSGEDVAGLAGLLTGLNTAIGDAREGNEEFVAVFERLGATGVQAGDDVGEVLLQIIAHLGTSNEDAATLQALLATLLGDEDARLILANLDEINAELADGVQLTRDQIEAAAETARAWNEAKGTLTEFGTSAIGALAPILELVNELTSAIGRLDDTTKGWGHSIRDAADDAAGAIGGALAEAGSFLYNQTLGRIPGISRIGDDDQSYERGWVVNGR